MIPSALFERNLPSMLRPPPLAQGTLAKRPLAHLVAYTFERRLTGSLLFGDPDAPAGVVVVRDGDPCKIQATGADPFAALAELDPATAFAYFDRFDALPEQEEVVVPAVTAILRTLRSKPPVEAIQAMLERVAARPLALSAACPAEQLGLGVLQAEAFAATTRTPFTVTALRSQRSLAADADILLYALLITKIAVVASSPSSPSLEGPAPTSQPLAVTPASEVPAAASSGDLSSAAALGRVRLSRTAVPRVLEETVVSAKDERASLVPPPSGTVELEARRQEIRTRAAGIDRQNYFEMLGLTKQATSDQVQAAFMSLAKRWHPDRLPAELADVRDACARVFARLSEAAATLRDPEQRPRYEGLIVDGGATPEDQEKIAKVLEAATAFQKGEVMWKRGDQAKAREYVELATRLDPMPEYEALLVWLDAQRPEQQSPEATRALIERLTASLARNERCERAVFYRASLKKKIGDMPGAISDFRHALELNPRNLDAQREVRLFDMRATKERESLAPKPKDPEKKGGLLGRLFKK